MFASNFWGAPRKSTSIDHQKAGANHPQESCFSILHIEGAQKAALLLFLRRTSQSQEIRIVNGDSLAFNRFNGIDLQWSKLFTQFIE